MKFKQYFSIADKCLICSECGTKESVSFPVELDVIVKSLNQFTRNHLACQRNLYRPLAD